MTLDREALTQRRTRRRRRSVVWRWVGGAVLLVCAFAVGLALGEALHDNPRPRGERTTERILRAVPIAPRTVTVTVSGAR